MLRSKKAEIGEAMTWIVATLVIIVVMTIFIFASGKLASLKSLGVDSGDPDVKLGELLPVKTEQALFLDNSNEKWIKEWIKGAKEYE